MTTITELQSCETEEYNLCVFQCLCGFHIGFDSTYLDQVGDINFRCPSCDQSIHIDGADDILKQNGGES